ncbi:MAG: hypothetical protein IJ996_04455 [Clostridia bacterium]|nr:hypothetical protein [Clostridia bacterium]
MKKLFSFLSVACCVTASLALITACGGGDGNSSGEETTTYTMSFTQLDATYTYTLTDSPQSVQIELYSGDTKLFQMDDGIKLGEAFMFNGFTFAVTDGNLSIPHTTSAPGFVFPYELVQGTYEITNATETITLNADGTGSLSNDMQFDYYCLEGNQIILAQDGVDKGYRLEFLNNVLEIIGNAYNVQDYTYFNSDTQADFSIYSSISSDFGVSRSRKVDATTIYYTENGGPAVRYDTALRMMPAPDGGEVGHTYHDIFFGTFTINQDEYKFSYPCDDEYDYDYDGQGVQADGRYYAQVIYQKNQDDDYFDYKHTVIEGGGYTYREYYFGKSTLYKDGALVVEGSTELFDDGYKTIYYNPWVGTDYDPVANHYVFDPVNYELKYIFKEQSSYLHYSGMTGATFLTRNDGNEYTIITQGNDSMFAFASSDGYSYVKLAQCFRFAEQDDLIKIVGNIATNYEPIDDYVIQIHSDNTYTPFYIASGYSAYEFEQSVKYVRNHQLVGTTYYADSSLSNHAPIIVFPFQDGEQEKAYIFSYDRYNNRLQLEFYVGDYTYTENPDGDEFTLAMREYSLRFTLTPNEHIANVETIW